MVNHISGGHIACIAAYCFFGFLLIPFMMPFIADGFQDNDLVLSWIEIVYYMINSIAVILILRDDLKDGFLFLQFRRKEILTTALLAAALMTGWAILSPDVMGFLGGNPYLSINVFPMSPLTSLMTPGYVATANPVFGTLCLTLLVPFSVCGIFYATGFAPACCRKPWLGYLCVTVLLLAVAAYEYDWRWNDPAVLETFLLRLPVHLLACWTYQKTDNIWTPIMTLGGFNLAASLLNNLIVGAAG